MLIDLIRQAFGRRHGGTARVRNAADRAALPAIDAIVASMHAEDWTQAEVMLRSRLQSLPWEAEGWTLLGNVLLRSGAHAAAIDALQEALRLSPQDVAAHFGAGVALAALDRYEEARRCLAQAVELDARFLPGWVNLGTVCKAAGDLDAAEAALRQALDIEPHIAEAWHNLGSVLGDMGGEHRREALDCFDRAIAIGYPGVLESRFSRALTALALGDLEAGWAEVDVRLSLARWRNDVRPYAIPVWQGESLEGRSLLVWSEQGVGDEILQASMYAELAERADRLVIECRHKLVDLFQRSCPRAEVRAWRQPVDPHNADGIDLQISGASLGRMLRAGLVSFPKRRAFLRADSDRIAHWRARLDALGPGAKIGFSWRSKDTTGDRALHFARLDDWKFLFGEPQTTFVCLQYGECEREVDELRRQGAINVVRFPELDYFDGLDEVAALMSALDLVISAPTGVSAQAAALGVPTWQLAYGLDWQTMGTAYNPWFPAMRRFERSWRQPWSEVLAHMRTELRDWRRQYWP